MGRVKFPKGQQKDWINKLLKRENLTANDLALICKVSSRTIRDWRREKFLISEKAVLSLTNKLHASVPKNVNILSSYWYVQKGAKKGALKRMELYGPPGTPEGRKKGGQMSQLRRKLYPELYPNCTIEKVFIMPRKSSKLAEVIGIILGDGGITDYQLKITLNKETEQKYIDFVAKLLGENFKEVPRRYFFNNKRGHKVCTLTISGVNLVENLQKLGLKKGNKIAQQVKVPDWVFINKEYSKACLRGLFDTDGGLYFHKHKTKGFHCFNLGLTFTSYSKPLVKFIHETLLGFGFSSKIKEKSVYLYQFKEINKYFDIIGSNNKHHLERLEEFNRLKTRRSTQVVDEARLESV